MYIDKIEYINIIDNVVNIESQKAIAIDIQDMKVCGCKPPTRSEMKDYVLSMRSLVQGVLEQSN